MNKMIMLQTWLDGTGYEYTAGTTNINVNDVTIELNPDELSGSQVRIAYKVRSNDGIVEYGDPDDEDEFFDPEDYKEELEKSEELYDKFALWELEDEEYRVEELGIKYIIVDLADPDCFAILGEIIKDGPRAQVAWKFKND